MHLEEGDGEGGGDALALPDPLDHVVEVRNPEEQGAHYDGLGAQVLEEPRV